MIDDDHMEALLEFTSPVMVLLFFVSSAYLHLFAYFEI